MKASLNARNVIVALVVAGLLLLPVYTSLSGNIFGLTLFTRIIIYALAAASAKITMRVNSVRMKILPESCE